ncbi:putative glycerol kinase 5 isoform X1 [Schistocerca serialis cubense]|uniref:putative glycerol kinase 5 isoform X1 n=2 Tax=Schistocerca serialis cubense TaxID=2023355 RepID=UPI00214F4E6B|nr:putative glycerol kinase 5 isoform X1 [Schistocerca serialis cubense]
MDGLFVAALDVGTTTIRCHILDETTSVVGTAVRQVELLYPEPGYVEIDPETLWDAVLGVLKGALTDAGLSAAQLVALGISSQRCTFITWDRETGQPFHNFITWKDVRADSIVRQWNDSFSMKAMRFGARLLYTVSRSRRYLAASVLRLMNTQVTPRLLWALERVPALRQAASAGRALYGGVDSWLLWRLTAGAAHLTDHSAAAATGFFDPFIVQWSSLAEGYFGIPAAMLPRVCEATADFGCTAPDILGAAVPIRCLIADQAASTFGSCCFSRGDAKVTLGTGTFLNVNTGQTPHASVAGLYPLIGWKLDDEITYIVEGASNDTGSLINWAQTVGWLKSPEESEQLATSVKDSGGVFFIPAFSGLQAPVNNPQATAGFLGVTPQTERAHIIRAILESLVFRVLQLYEALKEEANYTCTSIRIDGGVSQNTFVAQMLADLTGVKVERSTTADTSALGAGFLAGLAAGVWKSKNDLCKLRKVRDVFEPRQEVRRRYESTLARWRDAMERFLDWYPLPSNK